MAAVNNVYTIVGCVSHVEGRGFEMDRRVIEAPLSLIWREFDVS